MNTAGSLTRQQGDGWRIARVTFQRHGQAWYVVNVWLGDEIHTFGATEEVAADTVWLRCLGAVGEGGVDALTAAVAALETEGGN